MIEFGFFRGADRYCLHHCMMTEEEAELIKSGNIYGFYHPDSQELQDYEVFGISNFELNDCGTVKQIMVAYDKMSSPTSLSEYGNFFYDMDCCCLCDDILQELSQGKSKVFKVVKTFEPMKAKRTRSVFIGW